MARNQKMFLRWLGNISDNDLICLMYILSFYSVYIITTFLFIDTKQICMKGDASFLLFIILWEMDGHSVFKISLQQKLEQDAKSMSYRASIQYLFRAIASLFRCTLGVCRLSQMICLSASESPSGEQELKHLIIQVEE